jgi:hypothetical protein
MSTTQSSLIFRALAMLMVYVALRFFGGAASQLLYPIIWLVAFLHEFGHAMGAFFTGGQVLALQIAADGSGLTTTQGGSPAIILMGGYLGSAILGNLLFYIGARKRRIAQGALLALALLMIFAAIKWHTTTQSTLLLVGFAAVLMLIAYRTDWDQHVLMFLGMASVLYVIQDFRVGPSSDLAAYESRVGIFPAHIWMYIWVGLVVVLTAWNLRQIFGQRAFDFSPNTTRRTTRR